MLSYKAVSPDEAPAKMERWFYTKSRKKRKRKKDDFWSDYLRRSNEKIVTKQKEAKYLTESIESIDNQPISRNCLVRAESEGGGFSTERYQSNVFNQIFGKKFESRTIRSVRGLSPRPQTYHFCQK